MAARTPELRSTWFAGVLISLFFAFSITPVRAEPWDDVTAAIDAEARGRYADAVKLVTRAIDSQKLSAIQLARALQIRGESHVRGGNPPAGRVDLTRTIEICDRLIGSGRYTGEDLAWAYNTRGLANGILEREAQAMADYTAAVAASPNFFRSYLNRGNIHLNHRRVQLAAADFEAAIKARPDRAVLYYALARARIYLGDYADAIADCDRGLAADPKSENLWWLFFGRANAKFLKGDFPGAIADYEQARALFPNHSLINKNLSRARKALAAGGKSLDLSDDVLWDSLAAESGRITDR